MGGDHTQSLTFLCALILGNLGGEPLEYIFHALATKSSQNSCPRHCVPFKAQYRQPSEWRMVIGGPQVGAATPRSAKPLCLNVISELALHNRKLLSCAFIKIDFSFTSN